MKRFMNVPSIFLCLLLFALPVFAQQKTWDSLMEEGNLAFNQERFAEAEGIYREALRVLETRRPKSDQPIFRIGTLAQLAKALEGQNKTADAELVGTSAIELLDTNLNDLRSWNAEEKILAKAVTEKVYQEVADIFIAHKKVPEAETLLLRLIRYQEDWTKETKARSDRVFDSPSDAPGRNNAIAGVVAEALVESPTETYIKLGNLYFENRNFPKAEICFQEALRGSANPRKAASVPPPGTDVDSPVLLTNLGTAQAAQQKWQPAEANLLRAIIVFQRRNQLNSSAGQNALRNYVLTLKKQGRAAEAETFLDKIQAGEIIVPK